MFEMYFEKETKNNVMWKLYAELIELIDIGEDMESEERIKVYERIVDIRLKECRSLMIVGWENEKYESSVKDY
jgi:hypothetical protein